MKKRRLTVLQSLWWFEILISVVILVVTIPEIIIKVIGQSFSPLIIGDWFTLCLTIVAFFYILVATASISGHRLWRQFHYLVTALIFLLSIGMFNQMSNLGMDVRWPYFTPLLSSIFVTALLVLRVLTKLEPHKWKSILVIDDDDTLIKTIRPILMKENFSVLTANSGEMGLEVAEIQKPDLIVLDVILPGIKGREVCKKLKDNPATKDIPVVFLTAKDSEDDVKAEMEAGGEEHLTKPFEQKELIATVKKVLVLD